MSEFIRMSRQSSLLQAVSNAFSTFRFQDVFCDVTICCQGNYFLAHRIMLSAFSNYFKEILVQAHCKHPFIMLQDANAEDLEALLNFIYMGEICLRNDRIESFLKMAEKLEVKGFTSVKFETQPNYSPSPSEFYDTTESAEEVPSTMGKRKREEYSSPTKLFKPNLPMRIEEQLQGPFSISIDDFKMNEDSKNIETSSLVFEESTIFYPDSPGIVETSLSPNNEMIPENISGGDKNYLTHNESDEFFFEDDFPDHHSRFSVSQEPVSEGLQFCTPNDKQKKPRWDDIEPETDNWNLEASCPSGEAENEDCVEVNGNEEIVKGFECEAQKSLSAVEVFTRLQNVNEKILKKRTSKYVNQKVLKKTATKKRKGKKKILFCDYCRYHTSNSLSLTCHLNTHTGEKPYSCNICEHKFAQKSALNKHIQNHQYVHKKISCRYCDFETRDGREKFLEHQMTHFETITYECENCPFTTNRNEKLLNHEYKYHPKPTRNEKGLSPKTQDRNEKLLEHRQTHTDIIRYECDKCPFTTDRHELLLNHESQYHPKTTRNNPTDNSSQSKKTKNLNSKYPKSAPRHRIDNLSQSKKFVIFEFSPKSHSDLIDNSEPKKPVDSESNPNSESTVNNVTENSSQPKKMSNIYDYSKSPLKDNDWTTYISKGGKVVIVNGKSASRNKSNACRPKVSEPSTSHGVTANSFRKSDSTSGIDLALPSTSDAIYDYVVPYKLPVENLEKEVSKSLSTSQLSQE